MKPVFWSHASRLVLAACLASTAAPAFAQAETQVEQVVVTARKRQESDISVPVSVTALSSQQIERQAIASMVDVALREPSLAVQNNVSLGGGAIYLRGIGTNAGVSGTLEQSVILDIDGAPISRGNALRVGLFDLGEIQILKGPQALFFGKNSPAGVIAFRSKDPTPTPEIMTKVSYEPYANARFAELVVSGPLTDTLRARVFAHVGSTSGEKDNLWALALPANNIVPGAVWPNRNHAWSHHDTFVRGTVVWEPNDRFNARLTTLYDDLDGQGSMVFPERAYCPQGAPQTLLTAAFLNSSNPFVPNFASPNTFALANALKVDDCKMNGRVYNGGLNPANLTAPGVVTTAPEGSSVLMTSVNVAELNFKLTPDIDLTSVTTSARLRTRDVGGFTWAPANVALLTYTNYALQSQFTQEVRATTNFSSPFNVMVGGFYQDAHFNTYTQNAAIPPYIYMLYHVPNKVYSGFAQGIWDINPTLELAAGVRQTQESKRLVMTRLGVLQPVAHPKATWNNTSPEATLTWRPSSDLTTYVAYKTGFKSGGYAATVTQPNPAPLPASPLQDFLFQPEKVKGFEGGVKAALLDRSLRIDTTIYRYDYDNLQVSNYFVGDAGIPIQRVLNAASARQQGIDVTAVYYPQQVHGLRLTGAINYNDSYYRKYIAPCYVGQSIAEGCNQILNPLTNAFTSQDLSGQQFTDAPKWSGALGFSYTRPFAGARFEIGSDAAYKSKYNANVDKSPGGIQKAYAMLNGQIRLISENDAWEFGIYGKNLTNVRRSANLAPVPLTGTGAATGTLGGGVAARADLAAITEPGRALFIQLVIRPSAASAAWRHAKP